MEYFGFVIPESFLHLLLAGILGMFLGVEREHNRSTAGIRTHSLVSTGSCLFTLLSMGAFGGGIANDPSRIAAQIVSGVGFLGAGTIMKQGASVRGLTTAASIWVVAGIGMACGAGAYVEALSTTLLAIVSLTILRPLQRLASGKNYHLVGFYLEKPGNGLAKVKDVFDILQIRLYSMEFEEEGGRLGVKAEVSHDHKLPTSLIEQQLKEAGALDIEW